MKERLYIKNFGPIKEAEVHIDKVTILIGRQGSGKSTVAKLYSLFSWLEKSLMRHSLTEKHITQYARFRKTYCAYNGIDDYFSDTTVIDFDGFHYSFSYAEGGLRVWERELGNDVFNISKVMYVPAERSILGSVDHPSLIKGLGQSMAAFSEEYGLAKLNIRSGYMLPFESVGFEYDVLNDMPKLKLEEGKEIKLSASSSGFQSSLPLLLVSKNLLDMVRNSSEAKDLSVREREALQKEVESILTDNQLSEEVKVASLRTISSRFRYTRFVNIVEEMELNLFPDSQKGVLYELLENAKSLDGNRLLLTTHSPYVISYLTLAVKAESLARMAEGNTVLRARINEIVPEHSQIASSDVVVYEMDNGKACRLDDYEGLPSDDNFLNERLNDTNVSFDALLEIEDELRG